jgi:hypothetical protein
MDDGGWMVEYGPFSKILRLLLRLRSGHGFRWTQGRLETAIAHRLLIFRILKEPQFVFETL